MAGVGEDAEDGTAAVSVGPSRAPEQTATQPSRGADLRGAEERGRRGGSGSGPGGSRGRRRKEIGRRRRGRSPDAGAHERQPALFS